MVSESDLVVFAWWSRKKRGRERGEPNTFKTPRASTTVVFVRREGMGGRAI